MGAPILHLSIAVRDLDEAQRFYTDALGCEVGRVRDEWVDVWFFGMQLTLQLRPTETRAADCDGVEHFGVTLPDAARFDRLVEQLRTYGARWIAGPSTASAALGGKVSVKVADPSGNVIEVKHYPDEAALRSM